MKRKLFIGSSTEGKGIATILKEKIQTECADWIEPKIWADKNIFLLNKSTLQNLTEASRKFEYGIFVASADDLVLKREELSYSMRDNVLFEAGMFLGSLGLTRAFLLVEEECGLPNDYAGTTVTYYNSSNLEEKIGDIISSLKKTRDTYKFSIVPSTALSIGYFDNFIKPFSEDRIKRRNSKFTLSILVPKSISDISNQINIHLLDSGSSSVPAFEDAIRPVIYEYPSKEFWDIPTTLTTLNTIIEKVVQHEEIGFNQEKEEWITHEIRNFIGTLNFLISQNCICKGKVNIKPLI